MAKSKVIELKQLEKELQKMERRKAKLEEQLTTDAETTQWFNEIYAESECKTPRAFLKALMEHFGIRSVALGGGRGRGRPAKAKTEGTGRPGRKPRTLITPEIIEKVKAALKTESMNKVAIKFDISNPTVRKIKDGAYDKKKRG